MGKKRNEEAEELNLVPIMNLVTILIPFLLMAAQFVSLAVIDSTLPAIGPPQPPSETDDDPPLNLSIVITDEGYTVIAIGAEDIVPPPAEGEDAGPTIPCIESGCPSMESYDAAELTRLLAQIKDAHEEAENVILVPESRIEYEVLVRTMDAAREDPATKQDGRARELFPYVVIAGGAD